MSHTTSSSLPNPFTPLAFVPPEIAYLWTVRHDIVVGLLAVLVWDVLNNDITGYRLFLTKKGYPSGPGVVYIISRVGAVGFVLLSAIFSSAPIGNCIALNRAVYIFCPLGFGFSALLFFLRLRAVYRGNRLVVTTFFVLWLGLLATTILVPLGIQGEAIGNTRYCKIKSFAPAVSASIVLPVIYDTLVFCAISWRLAQPMYEEHGAMNFFRTIFSGKGLPAFTRIILMDGQVYYLMSMIAGVVANVVIFAHGVPRPLWILGYAPYQSIINIMACRVYRRTLEIARCDTGVALAKPIRSDSEKMVFSRSPFNINVASSSSGQMSSEGELFKVPSSNSDMGAV